MKVFGDIHLWVLGEGYISLVHPLDVDVLVAAQAQVQILPILVLVVLGDDLGEVGFAPLATFSIDLLLEDVQWVFTLHP